MPISKPDSGLTTSYLYNDITENETISLYVLFITTTIRHNILSNWDMKKSTFNYLIIVSAQ
ncbi:hypothetical protein XCR1_1230037 [Xenorhabdus cabanillasii JM26]|uniref:Uncharacterized protein n=1 Tax=Xenorhabdus cabanillasii JM26 TaxID=1427517 RepID=W1IQ86_9GAMM|nr:hypothetical protein XCR1_1230037 [Xenorhabdus cabanillasii JM26]